MKRIILVLFLLLLLAGGILGWLFFGPTVKVPEDKYFYIRTGSGYIDVKKNLVDQKIIKYPSLFEMLAKYRKYENSVKPGRYEIRKGMSVFELVSMLKNGSQAPVNLVITKLRTKESLAQRISGKFEFDSLQMIHYLNDNDTLKKYGLDSVTVMAAVIPNTYTYFWNTTPDKVFKKFFAEYEKFWNDDRKQKAESLGLTPVQVITIASIIDEETNHSPEKSTIASVYLNRIKTGMPLQADPTLKFALRDFSLKRIYESHKLTESPYNTYRNKGLPPGPICTPQLETIDAVLNAPVTEYLYFVAKSDFSGAHSFSTNYGDHMKLAKEYHQAQNRQDSIRKANK